MATIRNLGQAIDSVLAWAEGVPLWAGVALSVPLGATLLAEFGGGLAGLAPAEAVTAFSVVGGLSGFLSQLAASQLLKRLNRPINILELLPAVLVSTAASALATLLLLPPSPLGQSWADTLAELGLR